MLGFLGGLFLSKCCEPKLYMLLYLSHYVLHILNIPVWDLMTLTLVYFPQLACRCTLCTNSIQYGLSLSVSYCSPLPAGTSVLFLLILLCVRNLLTWNREWGGSGLGHHWTTQKSVEPMAMGTVTVTRHRKVVCRGGTLPVTIFGSAWLLNCIFRHFE